MNIIVSACLLGTPCRYDGKSKACGKIEKLIGTHCLIPVCAEILGGLPTPRTPAEIVNGRVITKDGRDVSEYFVRGAVEVLRLAKLYNATTAVLKERSPSCGYGKIYDGTFTGTLTDGNGICAALLTANKIRVIGESQIDSIFL